MIVDGTWLTAHLDDPHLKVVDCGSQDAYRRGRPATVILAVRSDGEWDGAGGPRNSRVGHIPGAVPLEWTNSMTPGDERCFKSEDELREMFEAAGITPEKEVITL